MRNKIKKILNKKNKSKIICLTAYSKNVATILDKHCDLVMSSDVIEHIFDPDELIKYLNGKGIATGLHYPIPIHLQYAAKDLGYKVGSFPRTEKYAKTMISLPIYPDLCDDQVTYITQLVNSFFNELGKK